MGLRFQKRISIIPGVRLNWSLGGPSVSVGPRGASVTISKRGVYGNVGIPGSGLSYRTKLSRGGSRLANARDGSGYVPPALSSPTPAQLSAQAALQQAQYAADNALLEITPDGTVSILVEDGFPLEAKALRLFWESRAWEVKQELEAFCRTQDAVMDAIFNIHSDTLSPQFRAAYSPDTFNDPQPSRPSAPTYPDEPQRTVLPALSIVASISPAKRAEHSTRQQQHNRDYDDAVQQWSNAKLLIDRRHTSALMAWQQQVAAHDTKRIAHEREQLWVQKNFRSLLCTNAGFMERALEDVITTVDWPLETLISYLVYRDCSGVDFDIDLPEVEDFPDYRYQLSKDERRLLRKSVSTAESARLYERYIHGAILRLAGFAFSTLPEIHYITVSGYTQRSDPATGNINGDYVISCRIARNAFSALNFESIALLDPVAVLRTFELRAELRNKRMQTIVPFAGGENL